MQAPCSNCGQPIIARGPEPPAGRFCGARDCQRARYRALADARRGPLVERACAHCGGAVRPSRTTDVPRYCTNQECRAAANLARRKAARRRPDRGALPPIGRMVYNEDDWPQCHVCGVFRRNVGLHALKAHGLTGDEYREDYELNRTQPLTSHQLSTRLAELARRRGVPSEFDHAPAPVRKPRRLQSRIDRAGG